MSVEDNVFRLSSRIDVFPVLHGSGDVAQEVRERLISRRYDCLAVPLPPSTETLVEEAVARLPHIGLVMLPEPPEHGAPRASFIPIDPCQAVIMGIRVAMGEDIARAYIDRDGALAVVRARSLCAQACLGGGVQRGARADPDGAAGDEPGIPADRVDGVPAP